MNKHHSNMMGFKCFEMHWMLLQSNLHIYELNKAQWRQNIQGMLNGTWFFGQGKVRVAQKRACYQKILNGQKNYLDRFSMYVPISQECFQKRQRHWAFISRTFFFWLLLSLLHFQAGGELHHHQNPMDYEIETTCIHDSSM